MNVDEYRKAYAEEVAKRRAARTATSRAQPEEGNSISALIEIVRAKGTDDTKRETALREIEAAAFSGPRFAPFQASFIQMLRQIASDPSDPLRVSALEYLAGEKDGVARQILTEGLADKSKAAVSEAKALQLLAQDDHANAAKLAKDVFARTSDPAAKEEAIRAMASDPGAADFLATVLNDTSQPDQLRALSASGLRSLNPSRFQGEAERIIMDGQESDRLKTHCLTVLERMQGAGALDKNFSDTLNALSTSTSNQPLRNAAARILRKGQ